MNKCRSVINKCRSVINKCRSVINKCRSVINKRRSVINKCRSVINKCRSVINKCRNFCNTLYNFPRQGLYSVRFAELFPQFRQPVGVLSAMCFFWAEILSCAAFDADQPLQEVDGISGMFISQPFGRFFLLPLLTSRCLKRYPYFRLTELNLENQIYQGFYGEPLQLHLIPIRD